MDEPAGGLEPIGEVVTGSAEASEAGASSGLPTWLLFVLVFVGGSVVLVAGVVAVVVVAGSFLGESGDPITAADTTTTVTTPSAETTTTAADSTTTSVPGNDENGPEPSTTTTVPTIVAGGENGPLVGQCIDRDELDKHMAGDDFSFVSCGDPHDIEIYHIHEFDDGPFPGESAVDDELNTQCKEAFWAYVGPDFDYDNSKLGVFRVVPTQGGWESGDRIGECMLADSESDKLTGSEYRRGGKAFGWPPRRDT
ncbi:MAG: septum formation family protein [Actinomycetota bacterium]|nr:septum formation family protein [Actinomycetota bacterium]